MCFYLRRLKPDVKPDFPLEKSNLTLTVTPPPLVMCSVGPSDITDGRG